MKALLNKQQHGSRGSSRPMRLSFFNHSGGTRVDRNQTKSLLKITSVLVKARDPDCRILKIKYLYLQCRLTEADNRVLLAI